MARIVGAPRTAYFAPTARRAYLTKEAAARAEARAMIRRKYPTEASDYPHDRGWHWSQDDRLVRLYDRLSRLLRRKF